MGLTPDARQLILPVPVPVPLSNFEFRASDFLVWLSSLLPLLSSLFLTSLVDSDSGQNHQAQHHFLQVAFDSQ